VGNPYRRDDAAGLEVARQIASAAPPGVRVYEHDGEPAGLLELWAAADVAYVVDMVRSGADPGTLHWLDLSARDVPMHLVRGSSHHLSIGDAVALARALDRLPGRLVLIGVEGSDTGAGKGMHPAVARGVDRAARELSLCLTDRADH
jgi:hydrogenase maturation protease